MPYTVKNFNKNNVHDMCLCRVQCKTYSKLSEVKILNIGIASPLRILQWAEKTLPNGRIYGEVLNANTLHHKTFKPHKGGLFCERIFGPLKDYECACGKIDKSLKQEHSINPNQNPVKIMSKSNKDIKINETNNSTKYFFTKYMLQHLSTKNRKFCSECDVEYTWSIIRRYQLGYIKLNSPIVHIWFLKGSPSYLSLLLDIKKRYLQQITYCSETITLENSKIQKNPKQFLLTPSKIFASWQKSIKNAKENKNFINKKRHYFYEIKNKIKKIIYLQTLKRQKHFLKNKYNDNLKIINTLKNKIYKNYNTSLIFKIFTKFKEFKNLKFLQIYKNFKNNNIINIKNKFWIWPYKNLKNKNFFFVCEKQINKNSTKFNKTINNDLNNKIYINNILHILDYIKIKNLCLNYKNNKFINKSLNRKKNIYINNAYALENLSIFFYFKYKIDFKSTKNLIRLTFIKTWDKFYKQAYINALLKVIKIPNFTYHLNKKKEDLKYFSIYLQNVHENIKNNNKNIIQTRSLKILKKIFLYNIYRQVYEIYKFKFIQHISLNKILSKKNLIKTYIYVFIKPIIYFIYLNKYKFKFINFIMSKNFSINDEKNNKVKKDIKNLIILQKIKTYEKSIKIKTYVKKINKFNIKNLGPKNQIYTLSHRERWKINTNLWQYFVFYIQSWEQTDIYNKNHVNYEIYKSKFIQGITNIYKYIYVAPSNFAYKVWQEPKNQNDIKNLSYKFCFFSGAGLVQQLLNELTFSEIKKLDKQNRFQLYQLNKTILRIQKQIEIFLYDKNAQKQLKEFCKKRDLLIKRTKLVRKLYHNDSDPSTMILTVLPVLPPDLRPIVKIGNQIAASDLNRLYQRVIYRNERFRKFLGLNPLNTHSEEMKYAQRLLQEAVDNLIQNGKNGKNSEKDSRGRLLKSLTDLLKGKQGRFRQFLLGKRVDYSGRSVIVVGPTLKLHECGIPIEMAKELYLPLILKILLNKKYAQTVIGAKKLMKNNNSLTKELLREVMQVTPILLNRAPTLHRLGFQAFIPKLVEGRAILLHPLVCSAFNADFDGDQMAVHVPITIEARTEAWKFMLARNNILSPATGEPLALPSQDMVLGCYYLTTLPQSSKEMKIPTNAIAINHQFEVGSPSDRVCSDKNFHSFMGPNNFTYYKNLQDVLNDFYRSNLLIHSLIWVKWTGFIENGNDQEEPIEIRISPLGQWEEITSNSHCFYEKNNLLLNQYIITTPGRILFNLLLQTLMF